MNTRALRLSALLLIVGTATFGGGLPARLRGPDSVALPVRPFYSWNLDLARDSRAIVGPIEARRGLRIRITTPIAGLGTPSQDVAAALAAAQGLPGVPEPLSICLDQACETFGQEVDRTSDSLGTPGTPRTPSTDDAPVDPSLDPTLAGRDLDLTRLLEHLPRRDSDQKIYLTIKRERPGSTELLPIMVEVESDRTSELPEFTEVDSH